MPGRSKRSKGESSVAASYPSELRDAINQFLPQRGLSLLAAKDNLRWVDRLLVMAAILISWVEAARLKDRFATARSVVASMVPSRRRVGKTPEGFIKALGRRSAQLLGVVMPALRKRVRRLAGSKHWRISGWIAFGVDGTRVECPMTKANEKAMGTAGRNNTGPQLYLTLIFHVATGMVWNFVTGDARASERSHLLQMLKSLPKKAMLLADAGFTGYELMKEIIDSGRSFIIRVGANVTLLRNLGWTYDLHDGVVYLWPEKARKRGEKPLILRLITVIDSRNKKVHLLTNVIEQGKLSDQEAIELYKKRWTSELIYRSLKQTMGKRKMACGSPSAAEAELSWAVIGLWMMGLLSVSQLIDAGHAPARWSVASSLRLLRRVISRSLPRASENRPSLYEELARATKDAYQRLKPKAARHWPRKKTQKPPGDPKARNANELEIKAAAELVGKGWLN